MSEQLDLDRILDKAIDAWTDNADYETAKKHFKEAERYIQNPFDKALILMHKGHMLLRQSKYSDAIKHYDEAIKLAEDENEDYLFACSQQSKGRALIAQENDELAEGCLLKALSVHKKYINNEAWASDREDCYYELLRALIYQRNFNDAKTLLEQAIKNGSLQQTKLAMTLSIFGDELRSAAQYSEAKEMYEKALKVPKLDNDLKGEALAGLGKSLYLMQDYEASKPYLEQSLPLTKHDKEIRDNTLQYLQKLKEAGY